MPVVGGGVRWSGPVSAMLMASFDYHNLKPVQTQITDIGLTQRWGGRDTIREHSDFILRTEKVNLHVSLYVISLNIC